MIATTTIVSSSTKASPACCCCKFIIYKIHGTHKTKKKPVNAFGIYFFLGALAKCTHAAVKERERERSARA